ncbi:hypothetical protein A4A49_59866, partial [Nicotiana attenuata]
MSFKIITLRWYHDGVLVPGNFARYVGGSQTLTLDVDVDLLSLIELMNYTRIYDSQNVAELYICPMDRTDKLINILTDKDILDICNELEDGDTLDIYVTHAAPLCVVEPTPFPPPKQSAPAHEPTPSPSPPPSPSPSPSPVPAPSHEPTPSPTPSPSPSPS